MSEAGPSAPTWHWDWDALPDLCIQRVVNQIAEHQTKAQPPLSDVILRRKCDAVRDVVALAATSKDTRARFLPLLVDKLNPPNVYETLVEAYDLGKRRKRATVAELKSACRDHKLKVSGTAEELRTRLRTVFYDPRLPHCGLGKRFCKEQGADYKLVLSSYDVAALRAKLALPRWLLQEQPLQPGPGPRPQLNTHSAVVREALARYKDAAGIVAARVRVRTETVRRQEERREALVAALRKRGCVLRNDSQLCAAYIRGDPGALSFDQVVDATEEIQFYYQKTQYSSILRELRNPYGDTYRDRYGRFDPYRDRDNRYMDPYTRRLFGDDLGSDRYWRRREAVKGGVIEDFDDSDFDSETGEMYHTEEDEEQLRRQAKSQALRQWVFSQALLKPLRRQQGLTWDDVKNVISQSHGAVRVPRSLRQDVVKILRVGI